MRQDELYMVMDDTRNMSFDEILVLDSKTEAEVHAAAEEIFSSLLADAGKVSVVA